jgi:hypothetical protein
MLRPLEDWSQHGWHGECQHKMAPGKKAKRKGPPKKSTPAKKSVPTKSGSAKKASALAKKKKT